MSKSEQQLPSLRVKSSKDLRRIKTFIKQKKVGEGQENEIIFSSEEMLKIWKSLFYCLWWKDKVGPQQELIAKLVEIFEDFNNKRSAMFFVQVFWQTMCREWVGVDRLRLDKFYSLQTEMIKKSLKFVLSNFGIEVSECENEDENENENNEDNDDNNDNDNDNGENNTEGAEDDNNEDNTNVDGDNNGGDEDDEGDNNDDNDENEDNEGEGGEEGGEEEDGGEEREEVTWWIESIVSSIPENDSAANGIIMHIADVFFENFLKLLPPLQPRPQSISETSLVGIFYPFFHLIARSTFKVVKEKIQQNIFIPFLECTFDGLDEEEIKDIPKDEDRYHLYIISTRRFAPYFQPFADTFESLASLEDTPEDNKPRLLKLSKLFANAFTPPQPVKPINNNPHAFTGGKRKRKNKNKKQKKFKMSEF